MSGVVLLDNSVSQVFEEPQQLDSFSSQGALKRDKKDKGIVIEASGSVAGQLLANVPMWKKGKDRGSPQQTVDEDPSPTLLLGGNISDAKEVGDGEMHQRAVTDLENLLAEEEDDSGSSVDSMSESEDSDGDMDMTDEVEDSTTLSKFQEGLRKEVLARKGCTLLMSSQKKGRIGESDDGDPILISRSHSPPA